MKVLINKSINKTLPHKTVKEYILLPRKLEIKYYIETPVKLHFHRIYFIQRLWFAISFKHIKYSCGTDTCGLKIKQNLTIRQIKHQTSSISQTFLMKSMTNNT